MMVKRVAFVLSLFLILSGCELTAEKIIKNPDITVEKCGKIDEIDERTNCFMDYAEIVADVNSKTSVEICNNLRDYNRNKCIFKVFTILETNNKIEEAIGVCKEIEKEGFDKWCESRRDRKSITVAPPL